MYYYFAESSISYRMPLCNDIIVVDFSKKNNPVDKKNKISHFELKSLNRLEQHWKKWN